jgi:hypothetical protein
MIPGDDSSEDEKAGGIPLAIISHFAALRSESNPHEFDSKGGEK